MPKYLIFLFLISMILMHYGIASGKDIDYKVLAKAGAESMASHKAAHDKAVDSRGVGLFYGSESSYATGLNKYKLEHGKALVLENWMSKFMLEAEEFGDYREMEKAALEKTKEENFELSSPPEATDCFEWCLLVLKDAYEKSSAAKEWLRITKRASERSRNSSAGLKFWGNGMIGADLAKVLTEFGWQALYYNPDTNTPEDRPGYIPPPPKWDYEYESWKKFYFRWKEHPVSYTIAKSKRTYYGIPVSDFIIDYRPTSELKWEEWDEKEGITYSKMISIDSPTRRIEDKVKKLEKIPFGFVLARGGSHTALISYGKVYEVHRVAGPTSKNLIEIKDFEKEWNWLSGVIIMPPGSWSF